MVKRAPEQRRKLPPELEAFARSDEEKLRIRKPRTDQGRVHDPREGYIVAGVANRDARTVYDVRSEAMRALWAEGQADEPALARLGQLFHEALRLELWRARRLTGFAAFSEEVVGVPAGRAEALAEAHATRSGEPLTPLTERAIALWFRTEAGLYEGDERARSQVRMRDGVWVLELSVELTHASTALAGAGARHLPLAREPRLYDDLRERVEARGELEGPRGELESARAQAPLDDAGTSDLPPTLDEVGLEHAEEPGDAEPSDADVEPGDAEPAQPGGARLLTRKPRLDRASADEGRSDDERGHAGWDARGREGARNVERSQQARAADARGGQERGRFGERRNPRFEERGERRPGQFEERGERHFGERGRRDESRGFGARDDRPGFAGDRAQGERRFGGQHANRAGGQTGPGRRDERRPDRFARDERGQGRARFDERGTDRFARDDRNPGRSRFGERRDDRPRGQGARDDRPRGQGARDDRPRGQGARDDRPRTYGGRDDRPRAQGAREDRPRFGDRGRAVESRRDDRPRFGQRDDRPRFGQRDDKGARFADKRGGDKRFGKGKPGKASSAGGFGARRKLSPQPASERPARPPRRDDDDLE